MIFSEARTAAGLSRDGQSVTPVASECDPLACSEPWTIASAVNDNASVGQSGTIVLSDLTRVQASPGRPNRPNAGR
jgi:hypothetical protein